MMNLRHSPPRLHSTIPRPHYTAGTVVVGLFLRLYQNSTPDRYCVRLFRCFYLLWQVPCICLCLSHLLTNFFSILCLGREARARRRASLYSILSRSVSFTFVYACRVILLRPRLLTFSPLSLHNRPHQKTD